MSLKTDHFVPYNQRPNFLSVCYDTIFQLISPQLLVCTPCLKTKTQQKSKKKCKKNTKKHKLSLVEESSRFYQLIVERFNQKTVIMRTKEVIFSVLAVTLQKSQWYTAVIVIDWLEKSKLFLAKKKLLGVSSVSWKRQRKILSCLI